jgi:hypothetical protein
MITLKYFDYSIKFILLTVLFGLNLAVEADAYDTKSNRQNSVRVDVRPIQLHPGKPARFEVRMNTHSGDLGQDIVAASSLKDDQGRKYQPTNWQGSPGRDLRPVVTIAKGCWNFLFWMGLQPRSPLSFGRSPTCRKGSINGPWSVSWENNTII